MISITPGSKLVGIKGLREFVPLSERRLQTMYREEGMPHIRIGGRVLFDPADVLSWAKERDTSATDQES
ncbi:MAG: hypothetical protein KDA78_18235 [Planctomycetaceae bacterium]|nr:hypothetical protein [Planctomycetaceae bacterium]